MFVPKKELKSAKRQKDIFLDFGILELRTTEPIGVRDGGAGGAAAPPPQFGQFVDMNSGRESKLFGQNPNWGSVTAFNKKNQIEGLLLHLKKKNTNLGSDTAVNGKNSATPQNMDPGKFLLLPPPTEYMDPGKFLLLPPPPTESIRAKLGPPPPPPNGCWLVRLWQNLFVRTREPFFSNLRTFGLKNLRTREPSNLGTFGLIGCNPVVDLVTWCRGQSYPYICSELAPVLEGSGSRRRYPRKGTSVDRVSVVFVARVDRRMFYSSSKMGSWWGCVRLR